MTKYSAVTTHHTAFQNLNFTGAASGKHLIPLTLPCFTLIAIIVFFSLQNAPKAKKVRVKARNRR